MGDPVEAPGGEFLLYSTEDGEAELEVRLIDESVWLSLDHMTDLFQRDKSVISRHIRNVFSEGELDREAVVAKFATTASDGKTYNVAHYNLDVIISIGYRVRSHRGTQFRIWATQRLREYLIKGFTMNDGLLKRAGGGNYFDELLRRIRDIRSSEKVFHRKLLDIYSTSIDYEPNSEGAKTFFATVQNKLHWAAHGHTAAEIIFERADGQKPNMGMTSWTGQRPTKAESSVAKNYLTEHELGMLNRIVSMYLDFAELQAMRRTPMYMTDWQARMNSFLTISDLDVLDHLGEVSREAAERKAHIEYERFRAHERERRTAVEEHFEDAVHHVREAGAGSASDVLDESS